MEGIHWAFNRNEQRKNECIQVKFDHNNLPWMSDLRNIREITIDPEKLFRKFVIYNIETGDPKTDCWEWQGDTDRGGYGIVYSKCMLTPTELTRVKWSKMGAHRLAYEYFKGSLLKYRGRNLFVCHICDNPPCCNPNHFFLGTKEDNRNDMLAKGRGYDQKRRLENHKNTVKRMIQIGLIKRERDGKS